MPGRKARTIGIGILTVLVAAGCGPRPLRTPPVLASKRCPPGAERRVGLVGFEGHTILVPLVATLDRLFRDDGFVVRQGQRNDLHDVDFAIVLDDFHPDIVSGATARRQTNIYFLSTVLAAWMIPVMSAFDHSGVGLEARVTMIDVSTGFVVWTGTGTARNDERPSGMPGENDEHYLRARIERVGSDVAAQLHDQLCMRLGPA